MNLLDSHIEEGRDLGSCLDKLLKFSYHLVNEIYDDPYQADYYRGEYFVDTVLGFLVDMEYISHKENELLRNNSIENAIFRILEKLLEADYFIDGVNDVDDCSHDLSRTYAIHIYSHLGKVLKKRILPFSKLSRKEEKKLLAYKPDKDLELEQETLEVISILTRGNFLENSDDHTRLYAYIQFLYSKELLTENEFINASCTNDIEETLKSIILKKLIAPGKITTQYIIDNFNNFSHAFTESRREEGKNRVDRILTNNESSGDDFDKYEITEEVSDRLFQSIIQAFEFDISEIYDRETLLLLLKRTGLIGDKEEGYFRTMNSHTDFARYLKVVLSKDEAFMDGLTNNQLEELERCFYSLDMYCGEIVEQQILETNESRSMIIDLGNSIMINLLSNSSKKLTHSFLDGTLELIQEYFPYKPFYMRLLHIDFDELYELSSKHHKSLQIIGILVFDILNASDSCFEGMYQYLQSNLRNGKTKVGLERIYTQKCQENE